MSSITTQSAGTGPLEGLEEITSLSKSEERLIVLASSLGTMFEWYDFYLYGSLAVFLSAVFFPSGNPTTALLASLATLAAGFLVRPFGAVFFGRLGDLVGRKHTFLITMLLMGLSTAAVGFLPGYRTIGNAAWLILLLLRMIQGLAVGGEYGGAVIYIAENSRPRRRGLLTSWIQITPTTGLIMAMIVILGSQAVVSPAAFKAWGWRVPFIVSIGLLAVSVYIRSRLNESPVFLKMKAEGRASRTPIRDTFCRWNNLKWVLLAIVGLTAGQGASWYTGQFYVMFFMQQVMKIDLHTVYLLMTIALVLGTPSFIFFCWLSDRIGRKWILMAGLLLAALSYRPLFVWLLDAGNPDLVAATARVPVLVHASENDEACRFSMVASLVSTHPDNSKPCVEAKKYLTSNGISFTYAPPIAGQPVAVTIGERTIDGFDPQAYRAQLDQVGYPQAAVPAHIRWGEVVLILWLMTVVVSMVYGPVAAFLVELFPPQTRYTSLSFPYHIGAGVIGGFLPFFATYISIADGNIFAGVWYPVVIGAVTFVVGSLLLPETLRRSTQQKVPY
ncbi:MFS transporter [Burkholderia sp. WAC0059]|uniref:MFS transporter n=1 Tax=Burkholderia sp. WAC0059 TaxID=2066022 RepID=UPI000C7F218D|nr:MFS transporter [Burkholderia sp. WAC0059]PLZ00596.1 MFS transporter [Burkholderia sp. WAC0059]